MNGVFQIGATGLQAQQRALHVVANNITNMNTPAFKRSEVRFSELVAPAPAQQGVAPGFALLGGVPPMLGVRGEAGQRLFAPGELRQTGNAMDVAIDGAGFIELAGPEGRSLLWRGGALTVGRDGFLSAANGMALKSTISVPEGATGLIVGLDGEVRATLPGETDPVSLGRIELVVARDAARLAAVEGGLYQVEDEADLVAALPGEDGGRIVQGSLELSNVELTTEMVTLMMLQRAYAASAQIVQAGDQLMGIVNGLRR